MTATAVVPVRSFDGLTRLADVLDAAQRAALTRDMAENTIEAIEGAGADAAVITDDAAVHAWAQQQSLRVIDDPGGGLDGAAHAGIAAVGPPWLVVHADLPLVSAADIEAALGLRVVLAPSHDGGTNLIGSSMPDFPFAYGIGSFSRHLAAAPYATVLVRTGLALDLDRARDLHALATDLAGLAERSE